MARIKQAERAAVLEGIRGALLRAAAAEFARQGYQAANINQVSLAAGLAKGTVYNYFRSKQALLLTLIDDIAREHLAYMAAAVLAEAEPAARLARFWHAGFAYVAEHPARSRVMLNTVYGSDDALKQHAYAAYQPMFELVAQEILIPGVADGVFRPLDVAATTTLMMTVYLGTAAQVDAQGRPYLDSAQVAGLVWQGLRRDANDHP